MKRLVTEGPGLKLKLVKDIFTVENLYTFECKSADDVLALYHFGLKNRVTASHNMPGIGQKFRKSLPKLMSITSKTSGHGPLRACVI